LFSMMDITITMLTRAVASVCTIEMSVALVSVVLFLPVLVMVGVNRFRGVNRIEHRYGGFSIKHFLCI